MRREADPKEGSEHILALNKNGVSFLDLITHETMLHYPFTEVISTRKVQTEDGTLFLDMKCGNLMQQRITRIQTEQANEIARLIRQYITIDQRLRGTLPATGVIAKIVLNVVEKLQSNFFIFLLRAHQTGKPQKDWKTSAKLPLDNSGKHFLITCISA